MKYKNTNAFSIVIAMGLTLLMTLLVLFILEYMIPYSKNVKGIENSTNAFYQAESAIEEALYFFKTRTNITDEDGVAFPSTATGYTFQTYSSGTKLPYEDSASGIQEGNSGFDDSFNILTAGKPLQLEIGDISGLNFNSSDFIFNVPDLDGSGTPNETLSGSSTPIINWQLSSDSNTLNATGSWITESQINSSSALTNLGNYQGRDLNGNERNPEERIQGFYDDNCLSVGDKCTLKFSIINKLELSTDNTLVPYLEYKIEFNGSVPLHYSRVKTAGKSYGFQKYLEIRVPQQTTNQAFDFTVFQ